MKPVRDSLVKTQDFVLKISLYVLLFLMGLRLIGDPQVVENLPTIGAQALLFAFVGVGFSVLCTLPLRISAHKPELTAGPDNQKTVASGFEAGSANTQENKTPDAKKRPSTVKRSRDIIVLFITPAVLLLVVIAGAVTGLAIPAATRLPIGTLSDICLKIMLSAVGLGLGFTSIPNIARTFNKRALLLPFVTAAASLTSGLLMGLFVLPQMGHALAVSAGFGWYSLSGVLIADLGYAQLGAMAFLSNLFRESLALMSIPVLQGFGKTGSAISAAGATSMDVTLPILSLYGAGPALPLAVYHGFVLSVLVPFLVPIFMAIGN